MALKEHRGGVGSSEELPLILTSDALHNKVITFQEKSTFIRRGIQAETKVLRILQDGGRRAVKQSHQCSFDILADGWKLDVKTAMPTWSTKGLWRGRRWMFNFHHQGRPITACDFFVLRLEAVTKHHPSEIVHMLLRAPFPKIVFAIMDSTFHRYLWLAGEFDRFVSGGFGVKPEVENPLAEVCHAR